MRPRPVSLFLAATLTPILLSASDASCMEDSVRWWPPGLTIEVARGWTTFNKDDGAYFVRRDRPERRYGPGLGFADANAFQIDGTARFHDALCLQLGYLSSKVEFGAESLLGQDSYDYESVDLGQARWSAFKFGVGYWKETPLWRSSSSRAFLLTEFVVGPSWFSDITTEQEGRDSLGIVQITSRRGTIWGFELSGGLAFGKSGPRVALGVSALGGGPAIVARTSPSSVFESTTAKYSALAGWVRLGYQLR